MFVSPARPAASYSTSPQGQPSSMVTPMKDHNIDISRKKAQPVSINNCNIVLNRPEASSPPMKQIFQSLLHKESYCPKIYPIRSFVPVEIENNPLFPYLPVEVLQHICITPLSNSPSYYERDPVSSIHPSSRFRLPSFLSFIGGHTNRHGTAYQNFSRFTEFLVFHLDMMKIVKHFIKEPGSSLYITRMGAMIFERNPLTTFNSPLRLQNILRYDRLFTDSAYRLLREEYLCNLPRHSLTAYFAHRKATQRIFDDIASLNYQLNCPSMSHTLCTPVKHSPFIHSTPDGVDTLLLSPPPSSIPSFEDFLLSCPDEFEDDIFDRLLSYAPSLSKFLQPASSPTPVSSPIDSHHLPHPILTPMPWYVTRNSVPRYSPALSYRSSHTRPQFSPIYFHLTESSSTLSHNFPNLSYDKRLKWKEPDFKFNAFPWEGYPVHSQDPRMFTLPLSPSLVRSASNICRFNAFPWEGIPHLVS